MHLERVALEITTIQIIVFLMLLSQTIRMMDIPVELVHPDVLQLVLQLVYSLTLWTRTPPNRRESLVMRLKEKLVLRC